MFEVGARIAGISCTYIVLGEHASGGMSKTFRARACASEGEAKPEGEKPTEPERQVLLKVTSFAGMRDWRAFERFEREVRTLSSLSHPRIPKSLELFAWDGTRSMEPSAVTMGESPVALVHVQELVPGRSLADALKAGVRFSGEELAALYRELLETLVYLHALLPSVLHRDLQPRNVILDREGHPHLVDFGLSDEHPSPGTPSFASDTPNRTAAHSVSLGAPGYVAPELVLGVAGPQTDLYALAATILSAASHLPATDFPRDAKTGRILVAKASPGLPARLVRTLERSLEVDVRKRASSAKEVLNLLSDRVSLASRVSFGTTRARIAAMGALAFLVVATPIGLKLRSHALAMKEQRELIAAKGSSPSSAGQEADPCGCTPSRSVPEAEEPAPTAATPPPAADPPKPPIEWQGTVVSTASGGPPLDARCALTLSSAEGGEERSCRLDLTCEAGGTGTTQIFDQVFGRTPEEGVCFVSQVSDVIPNHYRYSVRAFQESEGDDALFVDTANSLVRITKHHGGVATEVKVRLDTNANGSTTADVFGRATTFARAAKFHGVVRSVQGGAPVAFGAPCVAEFVPRSSPLKNCGVEITCGGKQIYKNASGSCSLDEEGKLSNFNDLDYSLFDDSPRVSIAAKQFDISDETLQGAWKVSLEMNPDR